MTIHRLSSEVVPEDIQNTLDILFKKLKEVGVSYLGHGVVSDKGDHSGYFSDKAWGKIYMKNQYFFAEPILDRYEEKPLSLIPWVSVKDRHSIAQLRNEHTKIASGLTICKRENKFNTFFNIGLDERVDILEFSFFKKDALLDYFTKFNDCHLNWRKKKGL
jgi:hypothetical protein